METDTGLNKVDQVKRAKNVKAKSNRSYAKL